MHLIQITLKKKSTIFTCKITYTPSAVLNWDPTNYINHISPNAAIKKPGIMKDFFLICISFSYSDYRYYLCQEWVLQKARCVSGVSLNSDAERAKTRRNKNQAQHRTLAITASLCSKWLIWPLYRDQHSKMNWTKLLLLRSSWVR